MKETKLSRETVYDTSFLQVHEDTVRLPNGKQATRVVVDHIGAAAVAPLTAEKHVVLVKQYRYALQDYTYEIPAGKKDTKEEDSLDTARRELREETGYHSDTFGFIGTIHTAIGFSNEAVDLFYALDAAYQSAPTALDEDEFVEVVCVPFEIALQWVEAGQITDAKTVVALWWIEKHLK